MNMITEDAVSIIHEAHDQETSNIQVGPIVGDVTDKKVTLDFETLNPLLMGKGDMIDITPDPSLLPKMGQVGYSIEQAVAELVDNSVDACFDLDRIGEIIIKYGGLDADNGGQSIEVYDDGVGMTELQARDAVVLGKSNKTGQLIGQFGMGMKTACTFLGGRFVIETTTAEDDQATIIVYDEAEFRRIGKWELKSYRMPKSFQHGTRIRIEKLRVNLKGHGQGAKPGNKPLDRTKKLLARQHRIALQTGKVYITVNTDPLQFSYPEWDERWLPVLKKIDEPLITGKRVYGVIGVAKDLKAKGTDFGFDLIRHGRIVKEYESIGFTRHAMKRNVYGMLHLDGFDVTNNKMDFIRDNDDWIHLEAKIEEYFKPIQRAIDKWYDLKGGPSSQSRDLQDKFALVREMSADGKDEIKWVLPGYTLTEALAADGKSTEHKWVEDKSEPAQVGTEVKDESGLPDSGYPVAGEDSIIVVKTESEESEASNTGTGDALHQGVASVPSPAHSSGLNGTGPDATTTQQSQDLLSPGDNAKNDAGEKVITFQFPDADNSDFSGVLNDVRYRHRAEHDGATNLYQSSEVSEVDGETLVEIVTNLDHPACSKVDPMRWYKHNVAEAVVEHLVRIDHIECGQQVSTKSAFLVSLMAD